MIYHPLTAYGLGLAVVTFLTLCGVKNRREGYQRERTGGILEAWELWLRIHLQGRVPANRTIAVAPLQQAMEAKKASAEQLAYHGLQLSQLQIALASTTSPVQPPAAAASLPEREEAQITVR